MEWFITATNFFLLLTVRWKCVWAHLAKYHSLLKDPHAIKPFKLYERASIKWKKKIFAMAKVRCSSALWFNLVKLNCSYLFGSSFSNCYAYALLCANPPCNYGQSLSVDWINVRKENWVVEPVRSVEFNKAPTSMAQVSFRLFLQRNLNSIVDPAGKWKRRCLFRK